MRIALRALALTLLVPVVAGAQPARPEQNLKPLHIGLSPADIAAIRATSDRWLTAVRAGRWEDAAATFTTDAVLRFGVDVYEGRAAIQKFHESMPPFDPTRVLHIDEIDGRGDMAFVSGHSTIVPAGGGTPVVVGRYLDIRLRQPDGTWLFYRDVVTPVPQPAPAQPGARSDVAEDAKTLAPLNHPNTAIDGLERHALVIELVEGEDLSARLARGPIPLDEALPIATQIAEGLEAAHEQASFIAI